MVNLSLRSIQAVILLDGEGNRVLAKYYGQDKTNVKQQKQFEKGLFEKTKRAQGFEDGMKVDEKLMLQYRRCHLV